MRTVGFNSITPAITRLSFRKEGNITLYLEDGRTLAAPLNRFPGIERLSTHQRRNYHIADGNMVMFQDDDEVYHIQDFLGTYETNAYKSPAKQQTGRVRKSAGDSIRVNGGVFTVKTVNKAGEKRDSHIIKN